MIFNILSVFIGQYLLGINLNGTLSYNKSNWVGNTVKIVSSKSINL